MNYISLEKSARLQIITLNRPEALNALNSGMVADLETVLQLAAENPDIGLMIIKGAGERAFCAGGDIKAARLAAIEIRDGRMDPDRALGFFRQEYELNRSLFHFKKPLVAFMNGITMGGGVGIAGACRYRIVTEKTVWAMPEVSIGFFPDVGAAHYLARAPMNTGRYLGLTGASMSNPADIIRCGFATHFIPAGKEAGLVAALAENDDVESVLRDLSEPCEATKLPYETIELCFSGQSVEAILENLRRNGGEWALATADLISGKSPTSLETALRHIDAAESETFDKVIARDFELARLFLQSRDFIEGVRAAVVDKDRSPRWEPAALADVDIESIDSIFNQNFSIGRLGSLG